MTLDCFKSRVELTEQSELEKVALIAYYYYKSAEQKSFNVEDVVLWFSSLHLNKPNLSRLKNNLKRSPRFITHGSGSFALHARTLKEFSAKFPELEKDNESVILSSSEVIPYGLLTDTRGYLESLGLQINSSYEHGIFDGCAVLMRRLLEILLIHTYEHLGIDHLIKNNGGEFKMLNDIIDNAKTNKTLSLSRNSKECINDFRLVGNFSAHKIYYNCRKSDIKRLIIEYRALIEELLYKSGIKQ